MKVTILVKIDDVFDFMQMESNQSEMLKKGRLLINSPRAPE